MRRGFAIALVATFAAAGLSVAPNARADVPDTRVVTWTITSTTGDRFGTPQVLFTGDVTSCGVGPFQQDTYRYGTDEQRAVVDALVAKGTLAGSEEDSKVWISNVDLPATDACVVVTPSPTPTSTPSSPPPTTAPSPVATPVTSSTPTPTNTSAPSPTTVATPSSTPASGTVNASGATLPKTGTGQAADSLAYTGTSSRLPWVAGAAFVIILGVGLLVGVRRRRGAEQ